METISVVDLAKKMNLKSSDLISKLMTMGIMTNLNGIIDFETAELLAAEYECTVNVISLYDQTVIESEEEEEADKIARPPVVTIMGHVDHGKTTLLDVIRTSNVVDKEAGNITQHIGAYIVDTPHGAITFLDTPGHEAFALMRSRGAKATDIVVLVVAANDGIMPRTIESIKHAKDANVAIIVAINKIDHPASNIDRVLQQLTEHELVPEEWGGDVPVCKISALKNEGIDNLLEHITLQAEVMDIKVSPKVRAEGIVIESKIEHGKGIVISVLIQKGIVKKGNPFLSGTSFGKVRDIYNDRGKRITEATPGMPVEIMGCDMLPEAGDPFQVVSSEKEAKNLSAKRKELSRHKKSENVQKVTSDTLYASIAKDKTSVLNLIVKGDVHGSVEAVKHELEKLQHEEVSINVVQASVGAITSADVLLASTSSATIIGFNVKPNPQALKDINREKVTVKYYSLIFNVIDDVKELITSMLSPIYKEEKIGEALVQQIFSVPKIGNIAGVIIQDGSVEKTSIIEIVRGGKEIHKGKVISLKRHTDSVNKVDNGYECGIGIEDMDNIEPGDILKIYNTVEIARTL